MRSFSIAVRLLVVGLAAVGKVVRSMTEMVRVVNVLVVETTGDG